MKLTTNVFLLLLLSISIISCKTAKNQELKNTYKMVAVKSVASCTEYEIHYNRKKVTLPKDLEKSLACADTLALQGNKVVYLSNNDFKIYNLDTKKTNHLITLHKDIDGVGGPFWSPKKNKLAFVVVNQEMKYNYTASTRIIIITLNEKDAVISKQKIDKSIYFDCGGICSASITFLDENTIQYRDINDKANDIDTPPTLLQLKIPNKKATAGETDAILMLLNKYPEFSIAENGYTVQISSIDQEGFDTRIKLSNKEGNRFVTKHILYATHKLDMLYKEDIQSAKIVPINIAK